MRLKTIIAAFLLLLLQFASVKVQAQTTLADVIVTDVDVTDFPQVDVQLRSLDIDGRPLSLQQSIFTVREDGAEIIPENLTTVEEGVWVHFVVDAGVWLNGNQWKNAQEAITNFVQTEPWMKESLDHVALTMVEISGPRTLVDFTTDGTNLVSALENYQPPRQEFSAPFAAMDEILDDMIAIEEAKNQPQFIVFLSAGIETGGEPALAELAEKSRNKRTPIYTVYLRNSSAAGNYRQDLIQKLATETGGQYAQYIRLNSLDGIFSQIVAYRPQYNLSYRSKSSQSGTHQVEIMANASDTGAVSTLTNYDIEVNPPRALIKSPQGGDIIRRHTDTYTEDRSTIEPTTETVVAQVIFPDEHVRRLVKAELLVDGLSVNTLQHPNPMADLEFEWSLRDIQEQGTSDFSLEVKIEDELGMSSTSSAVVSKVDVNVPSKPETATEVDIEGIREEVAAQVREDIASSISVPIVTCFSFSPEWLCDYVERPIRRNLIAFVSITISIIFSVVVWVNRDKGVVRDARETIIRGVESLTKRFSPAEAKAYLIVLEGDVNVGKSLEIYGDTPIGRSKQNAELLFQQHDENSPISRLHCTIIDEEDHFLLRDEDSANGTYINGMKLTPFEAEPIEDGDEIELARLERGGVRVLFQLAQNDGFIPDDLRQTIQTRSSGSNGKSDDSVEEVPF